MKKVLRKKLKNRRYPITYVYWIIKKRTPTSNPIFHLSLGTHVINLASRPRNHFVVGIRGSLTWREADVFVQGVGEVGLTVDEENAGVQERGVIA